MKLGRFNKGTLRALSFGAALLAAVVWAGTLRHRRVSQRIDRALFR